LSGRSTRLPATNRGLGKLPFPPRSTPAALLAFSVALTVGHHLPAFLPNRPGDWVDLLTPFAVVGAAAALLLALRPPAWLAVAAGVAAVAYIDGHGIHLAANSIRHEEPTGAVEARANFWDEEFGHLEWHLGLLGFLAMVAACPPVATPAHRRRGIVAPSAVLLGFTLFTSSVEGGTWPLVLAAAVLLVPYGLLRARTVAATTIAAALAFAAALMGAWALLQGGMPEFSDAGWL